MLDPIRNGENAVLLQKFADRQLPYSCVFYPSVGVQRQFQRRHASVSLRFKCLKCHGAIPLLSAHREKFFWRIRHERDVLEKKYIGVATERGLIRQRRQYFLKFFAKAFESAARLLALFSS